jgi:hypothetical protein
MQTAPVKSAVYCGWGEGPSQQACGFVYNRESNYPPRIVYMPVHDWTRVSAGTFHTFHTSWMTELLRGLNNGLLPDGYYAMSEQVAGETGPDVLTLHSPTARRDGPQSAPGGANALADAPRRQLHGLT